jgi:hypothetical protein
MYKRGSSTLENTINNTQIAQEDTLPHVTAIESAIGHPAATWPGNCYGVADAILKKDVVKGRIIGGNWLGVINSNHQRDTADGSLIRTHVWIELLDGRTFDPTR